MPAPPTNPNLHPLSFPQQQLWFLDRLEPGSPVYNVVHCLRLRGRLDRSALKHSLDAFYQRHEILRMTFDGGTEGAGQRLTVAGDFPLAVTDLSALPPGDRETEARRMAAEKARQPFDLEAGPLVRARLIKLAEDDHCLIMAVHHIAFDRGSERVLADELAALYKGETLQAARSYLEFARWQQEHLTSDRLAPLLEYWKSCFAKPPEPLELPTDRPPPSVRTLRGEVVVERLDAEAASAVRRLARELGVNVPWLWLAALKALLHRYTGQQDLTVGVAVAGREQPDFDNVVGFFTNTLPVRNDLSGDPTFGELARRVNASAAAALVHAEVPFEKLVEALRPERAPSRNPLFRMLFVHQDAPLTRLALPGLRVVAEEIFNGTSKFDLTLFVTDLGEELELRFEFSSDLIEAPTAARWLGHLRRLMAAATTRADARLSELDYLDDAERRQLLCEWNNTDAAYPAELCVHHLFERQAGLCPTDVAAVFGPEQITYQELDERATSLARHLRGLGVGPDIRVCLCVERSLEMLVGLLGALKAGGAYVPLDPAYPADRLAYMLADSGAPVLLTQRRLGEAAADEKFSRVFLDEPLPATTGAPTAAPVTPDHLAYVIYTSGSTGRPKGVAMPHRPLLNLLHWQLKQSDAGRGSRTVQFTSLSFDVSFQEIFSTWASGGTLVMIPTATRRDPRALWKLLADARVERLFLPFVALQQLAEAAAESDLVPRHLREVITAGEQLQVTAAVVGMFERLSGCSLHNHYGPTESHVVTAHVLTGPPRAWSALPPIGRPIANTRLYLLDPHQRPVPVGVPGELHIAGLCLARGYLGQSELTDRKFIRVSPNGAAAPERVYRTGDLARYQADGSLEFLGRLDFQVKIRGFRVEPGEIEDALRRHEQVRDCVVVASNGAGREKRLHAFLELRNPESPPPAVWREHLRGSLPEYMVPTAFSVVAKLPLTPSGKVDRKALLEWPEQPAAEPPTPAHPRTPIEDTLAGIWCEVLQLPGVGVNDNFFDLGGHSLAAIRVLDQIHKAGLGLSLNQIFQHQTIAELAAVAEMNQTMSAGAEEWFSLVTLQRKGSRPPLFLLHTAPGDLLGYMKLVHYLGPDQPVYGFQSHGLWRPEAAHRTLEEMAAHYVRLLRRFQPRGPYYLAGWCFGGNVALEMAWQLLDQGQRVAFVGIVEGWAHRPPLRFWRYYVHRAAIHLTRGPYGLVLRYVGKLARYFLRRGDEAQERAAEFAFAVARTGPLANREVVYRLNLRATERYLSRPRVYPGRITLFLREQYGYDEVISRDCGFAMLAEENVTHTITGDHLGVLKEPHVSGLAAQLNQSLADAHTIVDAAGI